MARIQFERVSKFYNQVAAVDAVSFALEPGEILALLGASGCGKTTTLRLIGGLERPDGGTIRLDDAVVADANGAWVPPESRRVGFVFQDYALFPHLSVAKNVAFGLNGRRTARRERVEAMLALVGLAGLGERMPHQLSGGQQQRVALARALAPAPDVLLLDEPFSNLDAALRAQVRGEVRDILRATGVTAVFVTHDQEEALSLADRVAVMFSGQVVQVDAPRDLYLRPNNRDVAAFVGEANLIPAQAMGDAAVGPLGPLRLATLAHGPVDCLVRPEMLHLDRQDGSSPDDTPLARVESVAFYGHDQRLTLRLLADERTLIARLDAWQHFNVGDVVRLSVDRAVHVFPAG